MSDSDLTCPLPHRHDPDRPRRLADNAHVCWGHRAGLLDDLTSLPALHAELAAHLTGNGGGPGDRSSDESGLSLNPAVVAARDHIRATLVSWTLIALEEGPWTVPPHDTMPAIAAWLRLRSDWLLQQDWTPEIVTNLRETRSEARALIQPNDTYRIELGPCPEPLLTLDGEGRIEAIRCVGTVIAVMRKASSREQLPSEVVCTEHGQDGENPHAWGPMQWHALGRRMGRSDHADAAAAFIRSVVG